MGRRKNKKYGTEIIVAIIAGVAAILVAIINGIFNTSNKTPPPTETQILQTNTSISTTVISTSTLIPVPSLTSVSTSQSGVFQNFEDNNGTSANEYCESIWYVECSLSQEPGGQVLKVIASAQADGDLGDSGGTVRINAASGNPIDISSAKTFFVWVLDTEGNNDVELRLCNDNGCYPPDEENVEGIWSEGSKSVKDKWTEITWDLSRFSEFDKTNIRYIQIFEEHDGTYYLDNIGWE